MYEVATNTFYNMSKKPYAVDREMCAWNGSIFVCGGGVNASGYLDSIYWFNPTENTTELRTEKLPYQKFRGKACSNGTHVWFLGGENGTSEDNVIWRYDLSSGDITDTGNDMPNYTYRYALQIDMGVGDERCFIIGGKNSTTIYNSIILFNKTTETATQVAGFTYPTYGMIGFRAGDYIYFGAGYDGTWRDEWYKMDINTYTVENLSGSFGELATTTMEWISSGNEKYAWVYGGSTTGFYVTGNATKIQFYELLTNTTTNPPKDQDINLSYTLENKDYYWFVNCTDSAGNEGTSSERNISVQYTAQQPQPEWKLYFVERDTANGGSGWTNAFLRIWINETLLFRDWNIEADGSYGNLTLNLTGNLSYGGNITFQIKTTGGYSIGVVLKDINLTYNNSYVKFTPWTITGPSGYSRGYALTEDHLIAVQKGTGEINFTTSIIQKAVELEIRPSGLKFNKTIYNISDGESIQINVTVHNLGELDTSTANITLYIDDTLQDFQDGISIPKGTSATASFTYTPTFSSSNMIKVKANVTCSETEGMSDNNYMTKYIIKSRPIFFTNNWSEAPGKINLASEPYATWKTELENTMSSYAVLTTDYYSSSTLESTKARNAMLAALYYQLTGDTQYANKAMEALINIGNGQVKSGVQFQWADPNKDGNVTPNSEDPYNEVYGWAHKTDRTTYVSDGDYGIDPGSWTIPYAIAYDMLHEYMEANYPDNLTTARDKLANMSISFYRVLKELDSYGDDTAFSKGYSGIYWRDDNIVHGIASFGMLALSIIDYDGSYQDTYGYPDRWIDFVDNDLFPPQYGRTSTGSYRGSIENEHSSTGLYQDGHGYEDYFEPDLILYLVARETGMEDNLLTKHPIAKGKLYSHVHSIWPNGILANDDYGITPLPYMIAIENVIYEGDARYKANWFINWSLYGDSKYSRYDSRYRKAMMNDWSNHYIGLFLYNDSEPKTPSEPSYIFKNSITGELGQARLRGDWNNENDINVIFINKQDYQIGVTAAQSNHLAFDIWAKGAYLIPHNGDVRFLNDDSDYSKGWRGGITKTTGRNMYLINDTACEGNLCALQRLSGGSQYTGMYNFANLSDYMFSKNLKFVEGFIKDANRGCDIDSQQAGGHDLTIHFDWTRDLMLVDNEYVILADTITGTAPNTYKLMIPFGSTHQNNYTASVDHFVNGSIWLDNGTKTHWDWYNTTNMQLLDDYNITYTKNLKEIEWMTYKENTKSPYTSTDQVNITVHINPSQPGIINVTGVRYGDYGWTYESYAPYVYLEQSGQTIRNLIVYYPRNATDPYANFTSLSVQNSDGNDYATEINTTETTAIILAADPGTSYTSSWLETDCGLTYARKPLGSAWSYFICRNGTKTYISSESTILANDTLDYIYCNRTDTTSSNKTCKIKASSPRNITFYVDDSSSVSVYKNGVQLSKSSDWDILTTHTIWVLVTFDSEVTLDIGQYTEPQSSGYMELLDIYPEGTSFDVDVESGYMFLGSGGRVKIYNVTDKSELQIINASSETVADIDVYSEVKGIYVNFSIARVYIAAESNFSIWNISNISAPNHIYHDTATGSNSFEDVVQSGNYVYLAAQDDDMVIYNITDENNIQLIATYDNVSHLSRRLDVEDNYAYIAEDESAIGTACNCIIIVDVSDPANPSYVSQLDLSGDGPVTSVDVEGDILVAADYHDGIYTGNVSNKNNPVEKDYLSGYNANDVKLLKKGDEWHAYLSVRYSDLGIFNVTNLSDIQEISTFDVSTYGYDSGYTEGIDIYNNITYTTLSSMGVDIINTTDESSPEFINRLNTPGVVFGVTVSGNYLYLMLRNDGIWVLDISDPENIEFAGYGYNSTREYDGCISGNYLYAPAAYGLDIWDISNPTSPFNIVQDWDLGASGNDGPTKCHIDGNYLITDLGNFSVVNITDPYNPYLESRALLKAYSLAYYKKDVYITLERGSSNDGKGIVIVNISDKSNPVTEGYNDTEDFYFRPVAVKDDVAYTGTYSSNCFVAWNISDYDNIYKLDEICYPGVWYANDIEIVGNYAYATGNNAIKSFNISNPSELTLVENENTLPQGGKAAVTKDNYLFVSAAGLGIYVYDINATFAEPDINVTLAPPGITQFIIRGCVESESHYWLEPEGQTSQIGILNATNNGTATATSFDVKLSIAPPSGYAFMCANSTNPADRVELTTSYKSIWFNIPAGETRRIWCYLNCTNPTDIWAPTLEFRAV